MLKYTDGSWLCGLPQPAEGQVISEEDKAEAESVAAADNMVNSITAGKARILDALIGKIKKINDILTAGLNKRSHNRYAFKRIK
jgi:hypothetical protein